jgi:hypothetical protein
VVASFEDATARKRTLGPWSRPSRYVSLAGTILNSRLFRLHPSLGRRLHLYHYLSFAAEAEVQHFHES